VGSQHSSNAFNYQMNQPSWVAFDD
jgi:hypothetical protein